MELKPVVVLSSEFIQPASLEFERTKYQLTAFDLIMKFAPYQKRMLFYAAPSGLEFSKIVSSLKTALSEVLVNGFHPLAGRMRTGDGISSPILEVDCTEELNVKFMEASTDTTLAELGDFEPSEFCDSLCDIGSPPPKYPWTPEYPLLFVQATRFKCGGISVAIAFSHQATDGVSAWKFMNSWAQLARTGDLTDRPQAFYTFKAPELKTEEEFLQAAAGGGFLPRDESDPPVPVSEDSTIRTKLYKLDKAFIEKLKSEAGAAKDGRKFTTYEVLCAYFWRKLTAARALTSTSNFLVLVSTRGRIESVSASYFGNAISTFLVTAPVEELMNNELSYAAGLLHDGIVAFDGKKAEKCAAFVSKAVLDGQKLNGFKIDPFTMVVSSPRHPVYETDFGFGRPIGTTFGTNDLHEGKLYLFPSAKGGGVDATVVLKSQAMDRLLEQDQ